MGWRPQVADTEFHVGEAVKPEAMVKPETTVKPKTSPNQDVGLGLTVPLPLLGRADEVIE
jgi:hypothetical protein